LIEAGVRPVAALVSEGALAVAATARASGVGGQDAVAIGPAGGVRSGAAEVLVVLGVQARLGRRPPAHVGADCVVVKDQVLRPDSVCTDIGVEGVDQGELFTLRSRCSECARGRLPLSEPLLDELGALLLAPALQYPEV
jgi:hypothetical protein